jgi:hypothetical protein
VPVNMSEVSKGVMHHGHTKRSTQSVFGHAPPILLPGGLSPMLRQFSMQGGASMLSWSRHHGGDTSVLQELLLATMLLSLTIVEAVMEGQMTP